MCEQSAAFTGPRPHRFPFGENEDHPDCLRLKAALRNQILRHYEKGVRCFLSGACIGVDMWAGEITLSLMKSYTDMALHCIIPFEGQADRWTQAQRNRYHTMLEKSSKVFVLSSRYYEDCFLARNRYLVNHAKYLIAVYDRANKTRGGTGQTVFMALGDGKSIACIHPQTCAVITERELSPC